MKLNHVVLVQVLLAVAASSALADISVNKVAGSVEVQATDNAQWSRASAGDKLNEGSALRTGGDGETELEYTDHSKVWLRPNSQIQVENARPLLSRLSFLFGSLKASIPHLKRNQKFEIRTNTAVAAVRGTEFTMDLTKEGNLVLKALYGELHMKVDGVSGEYKVPQGLRFEAAGPGKKPELLLLTHEEEREALQKWDPGLSKDQRLADLNKKDDSRGQIQNYDQMEKQREEGIRQAIAIVKNSDFEAGRTLTDINGNQVRVAQYMFRPAANSLNIVDLVKRSNYNYNPGATPYGAPLAIIPVATGGSRLDSMQVVMNFDHNMPVDLLAWPDFIKANSVKVGTNVGDFSLIFSNQTDPHNYFSIAYFGRRDPATDQITTADKDFPNVNAVYLGTQSCLSNPKDCLTALRNPGNYLEVWAADGTNDQRQGISSNLNNDSNVLRSFDSAPYNTQPNGSGLQLWLVSENAVIDNGGNIQTVSGLVNNGQNPLDVLRNTAAEVNLMVKGQLGTCGGGAGGCTYANVDRNDFIPGGNFGLSAAERNIDLVMTPDLMLTVVEKLGPSLANLGAQQK